MTDDYSRELEICKKLAVSAGEKILEVYNSGEDFEIEHKKDDSPLTRADRASNAIIVPALKEAFPDYAVLSEEETDSRERLTKTYCFVVDPLDGTKEFIKRNGQFTVNIGLAKDHRTVMGVIYVPVTGELFYAAEGTGSFLQLKDQEPVQLSVSDETDVKKLRFVMSSSHGTPEMDALIEKYGITNFVKMGSSLKGCLVAKGDAEVYYRYNPTMEWDTCAMQCIAQQAGAIFRQMDDTEMFYNREDSLNAKGFYIINRSENRLR